MDTPLAAIRFDHEDVDAFVAGFIADLQSAGWRLGGVVQSRGLADADCHCADMGPTPIATGEVIRISQPLGNGSRGCRLHPGALGDCAAALERALEARPDLLVLNRFGRGESAGRVGRDLIARALGEGVPVFSAVRATYADAWSAFGAGLAVDLPLSRDAVHAWAEAQKDERHAA
jgi:hypothetical protein